MKLKFLSTAFPAGGGGEIGFRPYAVQISSDVKAFRHRAILRHTYFLGIMLRVELELPSGLLIRARVTKEEYAYQSLADGKEVSFQIRQYRVLSREGDKLSPEVPAVYDLSLMPGEGI